MLPEILISIHPDYFVFRKGNYEIRLETVAYYQIESGLLKIASIGEKLPPSEVGARIFYLFKRDQDIPHEYRFEILKAFITYGSARCSLDSRRFKWLPVFRPVIKIIGLKNLDDFLGGYQYSLITSAALEYAARVSVVDP